MNTDIKELKNRIISYNSLYRSGEGSPVSDQEYDDLLEKLSHLVTIDEFADFRDSLNEGMIETGNSKVKHPYIMGSLDKLKAEEPFEVKKFLTDYVFGRLNVSAKVDGISCRLHYENGVLEEASTRGDGVEGQNITEQIGFVRGIQGMINHHETLDVRGELVIFKDDFKKMTGFSNPRNACAGIINRKMSSKDWNGDDISKVTFVAYTILGPKYTKKEQFELLENLGFTTAFHTTIDGYKEMNPTELVEKLSEIAKTEHQYETDGLVISDEDYVNEPIRRPKAQKAFKLNQLVATTVLKDIEWQRPSKDGKIAMVGLIEPVELGGAVIERVTLNNLDFVEKMNIKIGSLVEIMKRGDIIPAITKVISNENTKDIDPPNTCPCCGCGLTRRGPFLYCDNRVCEDRTTYQVMHFIKKLGVDFVSFKTLKNLGIKTIKDLVEYKPDLSMKSEEKFANELKEKVFTRSEKELFCAMNFEGLSEIILNKIIGHYTWESVSGCFVRCKDGLWHENNQYSRVLKESLPSGVGEKTMSSFRSGMIEAFQNVKLITEDERYSYVNENTVNEIPSEASGSICFTGRLETLDRKDASKLAKDHGFEVKDSVSKDLTYLVMADPNSGSTKAKKARSMGIRILGEEEFLEIMKA